MRHIPIAFPILFLLIIGVTFFAGAYAIAEGAALGQGDVATPEPDHSAPRDKLEWYESAAVLVCPLH